MTSLSKKEGNQEALGDVKVLGHKLMGLLEVASEKLTSRTPDENQKSKMHLSLLAYIQLVGQIKEMEAEIRDDAFAAVGPAATKKDLVGLKQALNFSDWAYDEETSELKEHLESENYTLLHHDLTKEVGYVGHFIAINPNEKRALIGIKGSSNVEDLLTDICALSVAHSLERPFVEHGKTEMRCHEGILKSAVQLADILQPWIEHLFVPLDYKILVCGHSLGAGAACLVVPLLRSRLPVLQQHGRVHVIAFASPPVMDYDSALACAPWTKTVVNNSDVIPRCSMANLEVLVSCLRSVHAKMEEKKIIQEEDEWRTHVSLFKRLTSDKPEMLMPATEARDVVRAAQEEVNVNEPDSLYVPGRVLLVYENWKDQNEQKQRAKKKEKEDDPKEQENTKLPVGSGMTNGTASVLRLIEIDERMVSDHFTASYHASVDALVPQGQEDDNCNVM